MADEGKIFRRYKDESRNLNWGTDNEGMRIDEIHLGCVLRIADAQEKMAENFTTVMNQRDSYYKMFLDERAENKRLRKLLKELQQ